MDLVDKEKISGPWGRWCRLRCGLRILQQWTLGTVYFHSSSRAPLAGRLWTLDPSLLNHSTNFSNGVYSLIWYYSSQHLRETTHWKLWFLHVTLKLQRHIHFRKILGKGLLILNLRVFFLLFLKKKICTLNLLWNVLIIKITCKVFRTTPCKQSCNNFFRFFKYFQAFSRVGAFIHICVGMYATACIWRQKSVCRSLFSTSLGSRDGAQVICLGGKHPYPWRFMKRVWILLFQIFFFFKKKRFLFNCLYQP